MNAKLIELAERRATLVRRAATQRVELSLALAHWRGSLGVVDQGLVAVRQIRNHAAQLAGLVAFVAPLRSLRVAKWLRRGWLVWRMAVAVKRIHALACERGFRCDPLRPLCKLEPGARS